MVYNVGDGDHPLGDEAARVDDGAYHVARFTRNGSRAALQLDNYAVNIRHPQGKWYLKYCRVCGQFGRLLW